ncbi:MAG: aminoacyl-tRNA hydrolase [Desulfobacterales bacterium CG23_combo_of_CG06-09_8_20_14_all_51_8]|nr:MAG: aminoacyl-tRNA hydrolase [Desulfobacterales bacterium CG23_combo_of_CG06-09_8_20_14_all_51_8]
MSDTFPWMIAGLGNPGREYAKTRHNIGFMVVDRLAEKYDIPRTQKKFDNNFGLGEIKNARVILTTPVAYMNRSGPPVMALAKFYKINLDHVLVIHDDIDILFGNLKIKTKGGHGGHNGIKSIIDAAGGSDFPRVRVGIGRPDTHKEVTDHVLGKFSTDEMTQLETVLTCAAEAAQSIIEKGFTLSMNQFNRNGVGSDNL